MKLKLNDDQTARLTFPYITGKPASLYIAYNPLTNDWMQEHSYEGKTASYFGTKTDALSLANSIIKKLAEKNLTCEVKIGINTMSK